MDPETQELLEKSASFIEAAQPRLAAYESLMAGIAKEAASTASALVDKGIIPGDKKAEMQTRLADPLKAYDVLRKMANIAGQAQRLGDKVAADVLGGPDGSEYKVAGGRPYLPLQKRQSLL